MSGEEAARLVAAASIEEPGPHVARLILPSPAMAKMYHRWAVTRGGDTAAFQRLRDAKRLLDKHHGEPA